MLLDSNIVYELQDRKNSNYKCKLTIIPFVPMDTEAECRIQSYTTCQPKGKSILFMHLFLYTIAFQSA